MHAAFYFWSDWLMYMKLGINGMPLEAIQVAYILIS
jgi:hypothetical protein